jgi:serine/threonine protein kinase/Ca2+-binding EF-hand superfamily protein
MKIDCCPILSSDDYEVLNYVQEGALGKVYSGRCKSTNQLVALKFFGYTKRRPRSRYIYHEIKNLSLLRGVEGIVQMEGIFYDSSEGILNFKIHQHEYPVIVMEWFEGGALFDRIHDHRRSMSEKALANIFKSTIHALENLHRRNIIHRDIKLENLMLVNNSENSPIKIIDFGVAVQLPEGSEVYVENGSVSGGGILFGTAGLYAPESVLFGYYSKKTDLWQAGCVLYSLLSGLLPFNPKYPEDIVNYRHYEMIGSCWDPISSHGKNLIENLLQKDSYLRYSCQETLNHCWIVNSAPETILNESYFQRIQTLKLKNKLKQFFLSSKIKQQNSQQREKLQKLFPYLFPTNPNYSPDHVSTSPASATSASATTVTLEAATGGQGQGQESKGRDKRTEKESKNIFWTESAEEYFKYQNTKQNHEKFLNFQIKIRTMKELVLRSYFHQPVNPTPVLTSYPTAGNKGPGLGTSSSIASAFPRSSGNLLRATEGRRGKYQSKEMTYSDFISILLQCRLPELAQPEIFAIFDKNNSGTIDIKEFLFTMLAFKQLPMHDNSTPTPLPIPHSLPPRSAADATNEVEVKDASHCEDPEHTVSLSGRESEQHCDPLTREEDRAGGGSEEAVFASDDLESRLFFSVFDLDDSGSINIRELEFIIRCLLAEEEIQGTGTGVAQEDDTSSPCSSTSSSFFPSTTSSNNVLSPPSPTNSKPVPPLFFGSLSSDSTAIPSLTATTSCVPPLLMSSPSIGELFDVMDVSKNGEVDYSEFKVFYNTIISPSNTPRDSLNENNS